MRLNITAEFARQDDCLDRMIPSDLRLLVSERDAALRERDGLRGALGNLLKECERSFDWQYDPEFTKAYNEAWELHSKGADHER